MAQARPTYIPFNAIDRYYMIPETEDVEGTYFPMSVVYGFPLKERLTTSQVVKALHAVDKKFPEFRLGYIYDYKADRLQRLDEAQLAQHFNSIISEQPESDLDSVASSLLPENPKPLSNPFTIHIYGRNVAFKVHHSFGDGRFMMTLLPCVLLAALDMAAFERLPTLATGYSLSMRQIIFRNPAQALKVFSTWIKTFTATYEEFKPADTNQPLGFDPIVSGAPISVYSQYVAPEAMQTMDQLKKALSSSVQVSFNTLFQALIAHRLHELGLHQYPPIFTVPIDLRRYTKTPEMLYGGNLAGQLRVRMPTHKVPDLQADVVELQTQINQQVEEKFALASFPSEWILRMAGLKTYKKVNRGWLLNPGGDKRYFVISNLGRLDKELAPLKPFMNPDQPISIGAPLMSTPPLVLIMTILDGGAHVSATYNPKLLRCEDIQQIFEAMTPEWLQQKWPSR